MRRWQAKRSGAATLSNSQKLRKRIFSYLTSCLLGLAYDLKLGNAICADLKRVLAKMASAEIDPLSIPLPPSPIPSSLCLSGGSGSVVSSGSVGMSSGARSVESKKSAVSRFWRRVTNQDSAKYVELMQLAPPIQSIGEFHGLVGRRAEPGEPDAFGMVEIRDYPEGRSMKNPALYGVSLSATMYGTVMPPDGGAFVRSILALMDKTLRRLAPRVFQIATWNVPVEARVYGASMLYLVPHGEPISPVYGDVVFFMPQGLCDKVALAKARLLPFLLGQSKHTFVCSNGRVDGFVGDILQCLDLVDSYGMVSSGIYGTPSMEALAGKSVSLALIPKAILALSDSWYIYGSDEALLSGLDVVLLPRPLTKRVLRALPALPVVPVAWRLLQDNGTLTPVFTWNWRSYYEIAIPVDPVAAPRVTTPSSAPVASTSRVPYSVAAGKGKEKVLSAKDALAKFAAVPVGGKRTVKNQARFVKGVPRPRDAAMRVAGSMQAVCLRVGNAIKELGVSEAKVAETLRDEPDARVRELLNLRVAVTKAKAEGFAVDLDDKTKALMGVLSAHKPIARHKIAGAIARVESLMAQHKEADTAVLNAFGMNVGSSGVQPLAHSRAMGALSDLADRDLLEAWTEAGHYMRDGPLGGPTTWYVPTNETYERREQFCLTMEKLLAKFPEPEDAWRAYGRTYPPAQQVPATFHFLTHKERNALMHALNGNIPFFKPLTKAVNVGANFVRVRLTDSIGLKLKFFNYDDDSDVVRGPSSDPVFGVKKQRELPIDPLGDVDKKLRRLFVACAQACGHLDNQGDPLFKWLPKPKVPKAGPASNDFDPEIYHFWVFTLQRMCKCCVTVTQKHLAESLPEMGNTLASSPSSLRLAAPLLINQGDFLRKCGDSTHTEEAVRDYLAQQPVFGRHMGGEKHSKPTEQMGFECPVCPLCWPGEELYCPELSVLRANVRRSEAVTILRASLILLACMPKLPAGKPIMYVLNIDGGIIPDQHMDYHRVILTTQGIPATMFPESTICKLPSEFLKNFTPGMPFLLSVISSVALYSVCYADKEWIWNPFPSIIRRGWFRAVSGANYEAIGWHGTPRDATWKWNFHYLVRLRGRTQGQLTEAIGTRLLGQAHLILASLGIAATGDLECEGQMVFAPLRNPALVAYTNAADPKYTWIAPATWHSMRSALLQCLGNSQRPWLPIRVFDLLWRARWNPEHAGLLSTASLDSLPLGYEQRPYCGCFQCSLREWYGPIVHLVEGTAGDRIPWPPLYQALAAWGLDIIAVELHSEADGLEYLKVIERGGVLSLATALVPLYYRAKAIPFLTLGAPTVGANITVSMAPPPSALTRWNFRMGPMVDSAISALSGVMDAIPRVAAYPGLLHLPRSADGKTFLKLSTHKERNGTVWAVGSSSVPVPEGATKVRPGNHFIQFEKVETVVTHGGAGTVQTAACAGARVVAVSNVLDRAYIDPLNAGDGVCPGQNSDRIFLTLLAVDYLPLILAFRGGIGLGIEAILWYLRLYFLIDISALLALYLAVRPTLLIVPGNLGMSILASTAAAFLGPVSVFLFIIVLWLWGPVLLERLGLGVGSAALKYMRLSRRIARSPLAAFVTAVFGLKHGLISVMITEFIFPMVEISIEAYKRPKSMVHFYDIAGTYLPLHVDIEDVKTGQVYSGTHLSNAGLYGLSPIPKLARKPTFSIPTLIALHPSMVPQNAVGEYSVPLWNCQSVILAVAAGHLKLLGLALFALVPLLIVSSVLAALGMICVFLAVVSLLITALSVPTVSASVLQIIGIVSVRFRAAAALERVRPAWGLTAQLLRLGAALGTTGAMNPTEVEQVGKINDLVRDIVSSFHSQDLALLRRSLLELAELPGWATDAVSPLLRAIGLVTKDEQAQSMLNLLESDEQLVFVGQYIQTLTQVYKVDGRSEPYEFERLYHCLNIGGSEILPDEPAMPVYHLIYKLHCLDLEIDSEVCEAVEIDEELTDDLVSWLETLIAKNPIWGEGPEDDVLKGADPKLVIFRPILEYFFFKLEKEAEPQDITTEVGALATDLDLENLASLTAVSLLINRDDLHAVSAAILSSKDTIHGPGVPLMSASSECRRAVEDVTEKTAWFRGWWHAMFDGLYWFLHEIAATDTASFFGAPIAVLCSFLSYATYLVINTIVRIVCMPLAALFGTWNITYGDLDWFLLRLVTAVAMCDPRHRTTTKPVWALLWKRAREGLTKGEQFLFGLGNSTYVPVQTYEQYADTMADLLKTAGVDTGALWRVPPSRAVFYPRDPIGVSEYNELDLAADVHFTEAFGARQLMEQSIAAGNGMTIDGAWMGTAETVQASIDRYIVPRPAVTSEAKTMLSYAADALYEKYRGLYERPLPMTPREVALLSKWKYSAGLPFLPVIKKRETLRKTKWFDAIITAAERILSSGKMPPVASHGFPKAAVMSLEKALSNPEKLRTVIAGDRITGLAINTLLMERNKRSPPASYGLLNMMTRSEGGVRDMLDNLAAKQHHFSGDGRAFDSTVASEVATVGSVRLFERGIQDSYVWNSKAATSIVHSYYEALTHGLVINLISGDMIWKTGGGGTGSIATSSDNRDWTRLVFIASYALESGKPPSTFFDHFTFANASDDVYFTTDDEGRNYLPGMKQAMLDQYGVDFSFQEEPGPNNILHMVAVSDDQVDQRMYDLVGVSRPDAPLMHNPARLLFSRSAYRSDRARNNAVVMSAHIAERSAGYQLLTAHNREGYSLVTRDLVDANLETAQWAFADCEATIVTDVDGCVSDGYVSIRSNKPGLALRRRVAGLKKRHADFDEKSYIKSQQDRIRKALKQRRGKSYRAVFELWVKPPKPLEFRKATQRWLKHRAMATPFSPLTDLARLGVVKLDAMIRMVPTAFTQISAEKLVMNANRPFNTWDFTVEQYIWRRAVLRFDPMRPPTSGEMTALIRESPFAACTDLAAFEAFLASNDGRTLQKLLKATRDNCSVVDGERVLSNDAIMGRIFCLLAIYTLIDRFIQFTERVPVYGIFVLLFFSVFKALDVVYSIQSLTYWVCTGMASLAISNAMPRDKFLVQKMLAAILTGCVPSVFTDYWFGIFRFLPWFGRVIELQALVPWLLLHNNHALTTENLRVPDAVWDVYVPEIVAKSPHAVIYAGVGTGKSTSLPIALLNQRVVDKIVITVPTNALVVGYVNDFIRDSSIQRVQRGDPADLPLTGLLIIMTHAQYARRRGQLREYGRYIHLMDEIHEVDAEFVRALSLSMERGIMIVSVSATPGGVLERFYGLREPIVVPGQPRFHREVLQPVDSYQEAVQVALTRQIGLDDLLVYHPSIATVRTLSTYVRSLGGKVRLATSLDDLAPGPGAIFGTGVIAVGANLRPAPRALLVHPIAMKKALRGFSLEGNYETIPISDVISAIGPQTCGMSHIAYSQLCGRVAREMDGLVVPIGKHEPSPHQSSLTWFALLDVEEELLSYLMEACPLPEFRVDQSFFCSIYRRTPLKSRGIEEVLARTAILLTMIVGDPTSANAIWSEKGLTPRSQEALEELLNVSQRMGFVSTVQGSYATALLLIKKYYELVPIEEDEEVSVGFPCFLDNRWFWILY